MKKFTVLCHIYGEVGCRDAFAILEIWKRVGLSREDLEAV